MLFYFIAGLYLFFFLHLGFQGQRLSQLNVREWVLGRVSRCNQMCRYLKCLKMHQLCSSWLAPSYRQLLANIDIKRSHILWKSHQLSLFNQLQVRQGVPKCNNWLGKVTIFELWQYFFKNIMVQPKKFFILFYVLY